MIQSTPLVNIGKPTVERAKTGEIDHYKNYPAIARKINKAIGGKNGRLPHWFKYSKNGRKNPPTGKKQRSYLEPNNSTMNRICAAFNDIGNINLHVSDIAPFNWQMLLSGPCTDTNPEMCETFCTMDSVNFSNVIEAKDFDYVSEREAKAGYDLLAYMIVEEMTEKYQSLEATYPYITKYLFADKAMEKTSHKQMYWRVYGEIALENLKRNLKSCNVCPLCGMRYPAWVTQHDCPIDTKGFFTCIDCNRVYPQINGRQRRCEVCQEAYRKTAEVIRSRNRYMKRKEAESLRIGSLVSRLEKT